MHAQNYDIDDIIIFTEMFILYCKNSFIIIVIIIINNLIFMTLLTMTSQKGNSRLLRFFNLAQQF